MGLIKYGSVVILFDNQISKDTDLYRLYNTNKGTFYLRSQFATSNTENTLKIHFSRTPKAVFPIKKQKKRTGNIPRPCLAIRISIQTPK